MSRALHIVVSCTDGKRLEAPKRLRLGAYRDRQLDERFKRWWSALGEHRDKVAELPAEQLYIGDHWAVSRSLPEAAEQQGWRPSLWVISAGYGLVPSSASLLPYAATFQSGHEDSVVQDVQLDRGPLQRRWWRLLSSFSGPVLGQPRSLRELAEQSLQATILVIGSRHYILSIEDDLAEAQALVRRPGGIVVVTTPARESRPEGVCWVPSDTRFQRAVGGSRLSIHARVGRWLIERSPEHKFQKDAVLELVGEHLRRARRPRTPDREGGDDDVVKAFIRQQMQLVSRPTHTNLLRAWRSAGRACEQARFKKLFFEVQGSEP